MRAAIILISQRSALRSPLSGAFKLSCSLSTNRRPIFLQNVISPATSLSRGSTVYYAFENSCHCMFTSRLTLVMLTGVASDRYWPKPWRRSSMKQRIFNNIYRSYCNFSSFSFFRIVRYISTLFWLFRFLLRWVRPWKNVRSGWGPRRM